MVLLWVFDTNWELYLQPSLEAERILPGKARTICNLPLALSEVGSAVPEDPVEIRGELIHQIFL